MPATVVHLRVATVVVAKALTPLPGLIAERETAPPVTCLGRGSAIPMVAIVISVVLVFIVAGLATVVAPVLMAVAMFVAVAPRVSQLLVTWISPLVLILRVLALRVLTLQGLIATPVVS